MGQGLFIKVAQVVAETFQIDVDAIESIMTPDAGPHVVSTAAVAIENTPARRTMYWL